MSKIQLMEHIPDKIRISGTAEIPPKFTVTFKDGDTVLQQAQVMQGRTATYNGTLNIKQNIIGIVQVKHHIKGEINKPSERIIGDHQFIVVDLIKMYEQIISVDNVNIIFPFTARSSQVLNKLIEMYAVPTVVTINQATANNISFTALKTQNSNKNINIFAVPTIITVSQVTAIVNEEEYQNANE